MSSSKTICGSTDAFSGAALALFSHRCPLFVKTIASCSGFESLPFSKTSWFVSPSHLNNFKSSSLTLTISPVGTFTSTMSLLDVCFFGSLLSELRRGRYTFVITTESL